MKISVDRIAGVAFTATNASGQTLQMDGPEALGGKHSGMRPMETLLAALAGCAAVDVVMILERQREPLDGLRVEVNAERADAVPAVFSRIQLRFEIGGGVKPNKADRAVALSMDKYCSVAKMLSGSGVDISAEAICV